MLRKAETLVMVLLSVAVYCTPGQAQVNPASILELSFENIVAYANDVTDYARLATDPNPVARSPVRNFSAFVMVGDIVAVNGKPAKGTLLIRGQGINLRVNPMPGQGIADALRQNISDQTMEILHPDGTPIGTIVVSSLGGGLPPPGAPAGTVSTSLAVIGGTGAFLGVRGQAAYVQLAPRNASMAEDPANRRLNGGGDGRRILHLIPLARPEIVSTISGPAIAHSNDFARITAARPAAPGETLSLFATGLGPTRPGVDPGKPFPASPLAVVNSPVEVTVNGRPAEVLAAVGYPGAVDGYQVNFRVPPDTVRGVARIQLNVAWIAGSEVSIPVQ